MELMKIENKILNIKGQNVMLDSDLACLYEIEAKRLNEAVKRNLERFPEDFMFQLTQSEWDFLRSQIATSSEADLRSQFGTSSLKMHGGRRYLPYVFTEQGVAMLSSVLNSKRAVDINISIMRIFVKIRALALNSTQDIKITELEKLLLLYIEKNDGRVNDIIQALNNLIQTPKKLTKIGFSS